MPIMKRLSGQWSVVSLTSCSTCACVVDWSSLANLYGSKHRNSWNASQQVSCALELRRRPMRTRRACVAPGSGVCVVWPTWLRRRTVREKEGVHWKMAALQGPGEEPSGDSGGVWARGGSGGWRGATGWRT